MLTDLSHPRTKTFNEKDSWSTKNQPKNTKRKLTRFTQKLNSLFSEWLQTKKTKGNH